MRPDRRYRRNLLSAALKMLGRQIDYPTTGNAGVEPRLSLIYTETVEKRGYGSSDLVSPVSAYAAKIMGRYPPKGALAVGSDLDIVLLGTLVCRCRAAIEALFLKYGWARTS